MDLLRWEPFKETTPLRDRINQLFDQLDHETKPVANRNKIWAPPTDVKETSNELILAVELPGIKQDHIDIEITGDVLTIRGEKNFESEESTSGYVRIERAFGTFQRSFKLGVPVQTERISAVYKDGVLILTIPKADVIQPKKVEIKTE